MKGYVQFRYRFVVHFMVEQAGTGSIRSFGYARTMAMLIVAFLKFEVFLVRLPAGVCSTTGPWLNFQTNHKGSESNGVGPGRFGDISSFRVGKKDYFRFSNECWINASRFVILDTHV